MDSDQLATEAGLFRPDPVLAVGIVADRGSDADTFAVPFGEVFLALQAECAAIVGRNGDFFSAAPPRLRIVARSGRPEAELAVAPAAGMPGIEIGLIGTGAGSADRSGGVGLRELRLPGAPGDAQAEARAGHALLEGSDILVACGDIRADAEAGSVGALVQEALERRLPVLLLPGRPGGEVEVLDDPAELLLPAVATELPRVRLRDNLDRVMARAFAPPVGPEERRALRDCLAEPHAPRTRRPEYPALLLLAARSRPAADAPSAPTLTGEEEWARTAALARLVSPEAALDVARQAARSARMEELATFYGRRVRSGTVLRYAGPAFGALMIALLAIVAPDAGLAWLGVQAVVMTLTIAEGNAATRGRWSERWLDYRSLAERLRCDRYLTLFGTGIARLGIVSEAEDPVWMRWCHTRLLREIWPVGLVTDEVVRTGFLHLAEVEVAGQIRYHEAASLRFRSLARRLRIIATGAIIGAIIASLVLFGQTLFAADARALKPLLLALLITLPSLFLAVRGLRLEGAFDLAAARSDQTLLALRRLRERMNAGPPTFERLLQASYAAAGAMVLETADWRVGQQRSRTPYRTEMTAGADKTVRPAARS